MKGRSVTAVNFLECSMACKETSIYFHGFVQVLLDVEILHGKPTITLHSLFASGVVIKRQAAVKQMTASDINNDFLYASVLAYGIRGVGARVLFKAVNSRTCMTSLWISRRVVSPVFLTRPLYLSIGWGCLEDVHSVLSKNPSSH